MDPMNAAALREALEGLADNATVIEAASGQQLVDVDTDAFGRVVLMFLDTAPPRRRANNSITGTCTGTAVQIGGDLHGGMVL